MFKGIQGEARDRLGTPVLYPAAIMYSLCFISVSGVAVNSIRTNCSVTLMGLARAASAAGGKWSARVKPERILKGVSDFEVCVTGRELNMAKLVLLPRPNFRSRSKSYAGKEAKKRLDDEIKVKIHNWHLHSMKLANMSLQVVPNTVYGGKSKPKNKKYKLLNLGLNVFVLFALLE